MVLLAAAAFILTACSGLQEDGGEKSIRINLPPIVSASGNSRALSGDRLPTLKTETRKYRVTVNGITREGTGSSYEFTLAVGIRATAIIECLNSNGDVIIRAVKDFTVSGGENSIDINLKNDGNEIIPSAPQPVPNQVTYSYGEADRHGNKNGIPSDPKTYSEGDLFTVEDGSGMTWDHAAQSGFAGWSASPAIEPENGGQATNAPTSGQKYKMPRGGVTLTAQWNKKSYTITYYDNAPRDTSGAAQITWGGDNPTQQPTTVTALDNATVYGQTPTSTQFGGKDWTFTGWLGSDGNTYQPGQSIPSVTENFTLTAQWSDKDVWKVTYIKGNTQATEQNITNWKGSENVVDGKSVILPTLQATGYTFNGWQITGEAGNKTGSYRPTGNVDATAQWTPITYSITYNPDGGNVNPSSDTFDVTTGTINFPQANGKTGYSFDYWKAANGTNVTGMGGEQLAALVPSGSTTLALTAVWREETYNITYTVESGEGTGTVSATFTITQNGGQVTLNNGTAGFTRSGYRIASWKYDDNSSAGNAGAQVAASALIAKAGGSTSLQLTAVWTPITYTITYNANGGGNNPGNTTFTVESGTVTLDTGSSLSNSGYGFAGWSTQQNGTAITDTSAQALIGLMSGSNTSITLYAVWKTGFDVTDSGGSTINYDDFTDAWNSANETTATLKLYQDASSVGVTLTGGNVTLDLNGKTLTGNDSTTAGSPVITIGASSSQEMCTLTLKGNGRITLGNSPSIGGGGVYIYPNGKFIMQGGSLYFNTASAPRGFGVNGGGVYNAGTFVMEGGEITMCIASVGNGGGIYVAASATFTKTGGTVSGNSAEDGGVGNQLFVAQNGTYNINGNAITVSAAEGFALDDAF